MVEIVTLKFLQIVWCIQNKFVSLQRSNNV